MDFLAQKSRRGLMLASLSLVMVVAQWLGLNHDLDHEFHEHGKFCELFLVQNNLADSVSTVVQLPEPVPGIYLSRLFQLDQVKEPVVRSPIRAPPLSLV